MYHKYHTEGLVISSKFEGVHNRRLIIFTREMGILSASVQGARNIASKMRAGSQDFSGGEFSLIHGKGGWKVVGIRVYKNWYETLRLSNQKISVAGNVTNLLKKLMGEEETNKPLFELICNFFSFLAEIDNSQVSLAECLVLLKILHHLGYMREDPELSIPINTSEISRVEMEKIIPRRNQVIKMINESIKATQI